MATAARQRRWRERHPHLAAWHHHLWCARSRGIRVEWEYEEFLQFCAMTGYIELLRDGWTIDRSEADQGYKLLNVQLLTRADNCGKGNAERSSAYRYR